MNLFEMEEIEELVEELTAASEAYYGGKPIMSDPVYDAKEMRLRELDPDNKYFDKVGADIKESTFEKVEHDSLMLSLDKAYSLSEVVNWARPYKGISMPKMDGFALSLKYIRQGNELVYTQAVTRGKGKSGDDVTENARQIADIPETLPCILGLDKIEIRGEVYMKRSVFEELNLASEFENRRNVAPGSVRQRDPRVTKSRKLNFFAYNLIGIGETMTEKFEILAKLGVPVVEYITVDLSDNDQLEMAYRNYESMRDSYDFDIDGVVFMINDSGVFEELGNTSHHPRGAIAWKFEAEEGETTFLRYEWQVSRTGLVNPVGIYEGIRIDGATLTNATLHNLSIVKSLGIGIGDKVIVSRRGGVIPKIERVSVSAGNPIEIPTKCPVCSSNLEVHTSKDGIETLHCVSLNCSAQTLTGILHFISVMEIMDVGESMVTKLMEAGYIETPVDLFKLTRDQLLSLESVKDKTADRTLNNIALAKRKPLAVFLAALGITNLGKNVSESVANHFENLDAVLKASASEFEAIEGVGDIMSATIQEGLAAKSALIAALREQIEIIGIEPKKTDGCLAGKSFLITGTLSEPRHYFEGLIEQNGGVLKSSVSKKLDYLIVGDDPGGKVSKAKKAGVNLITEEEFKSML